MGFGFEILKHDSHNHNNHKCMTYMGNITPMEFLFLGIMIYTIMFFMSWES
jgi:hypothetical protein